MTDFNKKKVGIIGAGALGKVYASYLINSSVETYLFVKEKQLKPLLENGYKVKIKKKPLQVIKPKNVLSIENIDEVKDVVSKLDYLIISTRYEALDGILKLLSKINENDYVLAVFCPVWNEDILHQHKLELKTVLVNPGVTAMFKDDVVEYKVLPTRTGCFYRCENQIGKDFTEIFVRCGLKKIKYSKNLKYYLPIVYSMVFPLAFITELNGFNVKKTLSKKQKRMFYDAIGVMKENSSNFARLINKDYLLLKLLRLIPSSIYRILTKIAYFLSGKYLYEITEIHTEKIAEQTKTMLFELEEIFKNKNIDSNKLSNLLTKSDR